MCWDAPTSFATLGVGTVLNVASYALLRRWRSPTALMVWAWQYALLMQIPEGVVWLRLDAGRTDVAAASRAAMALNVTQPLALMCGIRFGGLYREFRYAYVALLMYGVVLATHAGEMWSRARSIAPEPGCTHLDLRYWDTSRGLVYVAASLCVLSEARPLAWVGVNGAIFVASLVLAQTLYSCGVGSVWCWFIFVAGPLLVAADRLMACARAAPPPSSALPVRDCVARPGPGGGRLVHSVVTQRAPGR